MRPDYSDHALERMAQRGISREEVEATISQPDSMRETRRGRKEARRVLAGRRLKVVYKALAGRYLVVTAMWEEA